jgi:diadenosine tetraphosphate (Ap4A) HIT family hydrolase
MFPSKKASLQAINACARYYLLCKKYSMQAQGFNIGLNLGSVAGAGLPGHLHWHIVPRWHGDVNFMPTTAGVRVLPQALDALWEQLVGQRTEARR